MYLGQRVGGVLQSKTRVLNHCLIMDAFEILIKATEYLPRNKHAYMILSPFASFMLSP